MGWPVAIVIVSVIFAVAVVIMTFIARPRK
jgi:hypothetical protein